MAALAAGVEGRKTDTGSMAVSSAELTALDLLRYTHASGGIDNVATALSDIGRNIDPERLAWLSMASERPVVQRLGHLLDHVGRDDLADPRPRLRPRGPAEEQPRRPLGAQQGTVQAAQRGRAPLPAPQGLPAHLLPLREARPHVPRLHRLRTHRRGASIVLTRPRAQGRVYPLEGNSPLREIQRLNASKAALECFQSKDSVNCTLASTRQPRTYSGLRALK